MTNKKRMRVALMTFVLMLTLVLTGCSWSFGNNQDNIKIEIKGDSEITLYVNPTKEEEQNSTVLLVSVSGVGEDVSKQVTYTIENKDCIEVTVGEPDREGVTEVTVKAKHGGSTNVTIMSVYGNKTLTFKVNVIEQLTNISVYPNYSQTVYTNSINALDPISIIKFEPASSSQKQIKFELAEAYQHIEITENNGLSSLVVGEECGTQIIKIRATVMDGEQALAGIPSVEFNVRVIEKLNIETVTIKNKTLDEYIANVNGVYETIELTSNSPIASKYRSNELQIEIAPKNQTDCKFLINDYSCMDLGIADLSKNGDESTFEYKATGVSFGDTALRFVVTIEGFEGYSYEVKIPVHVIELPSVVTVNGNNEDFSGTLFTVYDKKGMEFNVTVGSSNAYDFRYEIRCDSTVVTLYDSTGGVISLMDIEGDTLKRTNPRQAQTGDKIYIVAKAEAADKNVQSVISFIAYATLDKEDSIVQTNYNFTVSQGVKNIALEEFENNTIYIEKDGSATLNYVLEPTSEDGEALSYDDSYISYEIMTNGGGEYISVEKSTEVNGQFKIKGLKNTEKVALCVKAANGVYSDPINVRVYTPGTFVAVELPSASTSNNILSTNYSKIGYGYNGVYSIDSLAQPFGEISYENGVVATLQDGESVDTPVFAGIIATNTTTRFTLKNDPSNEEQTILSTSYKFMVPQESGNTITFREFDSKVDKVKGTITSGGYLQTTSDGTLYVLIEAKFMAGGEGNGTVTTKSYYRLVAINSYPKITTVSLKTVSEDVVYNKEGLGEIDVMSSDLKTYSYTRLTIGPESALSKEILRRENTELAWELLGVPSGIEVRTRLASEFKEFNTEAEESIKDLGKGITIVFEDSQGAYEFSDSEEYIYTRVYVFYDFEDSYFGRRNNLVFTLSAQLTQFNSVFSRSVSITVKRPVVASSIDLNYATTNVSTNSNKLMTELTKYTFELYIDSREGLNEVQDLEGVTQANKNLTNSWKITATLNPSNVTNGKINYLLCDGEGNLIDGESTIIKVLNDGTIIPLSAGVAYVKLVPMSGELSNNYIIVVRVSNGDSWETAFKIYDEDNLKAIGEYKDIYNTMTKYYELANDIYLTSKFAPLGIFDDEVVQFSGGIRGASEFSS
ncbi:MAG: hypothetical protein IJW82_06005, partial [Clostridia bacterium]|nr:hypothetical protein [Clostridia bacterium]